jgi:hypothetical protein
MADTDTTSSDPAGDAADAIEKTAIKSGTEAYDKAVKSGQPPTPETVSNAAAVAGAAGAVAACAATGVGVAVAPFCGLAGAAVAKWVSANLSGIGDAINNLFGSKSPPPPILIDGPNIQAAPFTDLYHPTQAIHGAMLEALAADILFLQGMHNDLRLQEFYSANQVLLNLRDVHGLTLITGGDPLYAWTVPDPSRPGPGHLMPVDFDVANRGWDLQPPDITKDFQKINNEAGSSWTQKANEMKYVLAMAKAWMDQLQLVTGREATVLSSRAVADGIIKNVRYDGSAPPTVAHLTPDLSHVAIGRGAQLPGVSAGVTFLLRHDRLA